MEQLENIEERLERLENKYEGLLVSDSFIKRVVGVTLYAFLGHFILYIIFFIILFIYYVITL